MEKAARKIKWQQVLKVALIAFVSILLNDAGRRFNAWLNLPMWLDTFGVLLSAYTLGPVSGAIVGAASNAVIAFSSPESLVYGIVSAFVGITAGIYARRGGFRSFFSSTSYGAFLALGTSVFSTILNLIFSGGMTTNDWGDAIVRLCRSVGILPVFSSFIGAAYLEFVDKVATVTVFWLCLEFYHWARKKIREVSARRKEQGGHDGRKRTAQKRIRQERTQQEEIKQERTTPKRMKQEREDSPKTGNIVRGCFLSAMISFLVAAVPFSSEAKTRYSSKVDFDSYQSTVFDAGNGLVTGHATDVTADQDGSLWIGSYAGLYRYDGSTFEAQNYPGIKSVNCLLTDRDGRLWVGTNDSGLALIMNENTVRVADTESGLCSDSIRTIVQASDGTYYVGTADYVERIRLTDGIYIVGELPEVTFAKSMAADGSGNVAAASEDGTLSLIRDGAVTDRIRNEDNPDGSISAVAFAADGELLAGTENGRLIRYALQEGILSRSGSVRLGQDTVVNSIEKLDGGDLLVLTDQGLFRVAEEDGSSAVSIVDTGEFTHSLQRMTVDYQGNIWIASTRDGLLELSDSAFRDLFGECGVSEHLVNACIRWQDYLYAGCDDGLVILDESGKTQIQNDLTDMLEGTRIRYFTTDEDGRLYIATYGEGIIIVYPDGSAHAVSGTYSPGIRVRTLYTDADGTVAASGERGISFFQDGRAVGRISYGSELGNAAALCFAQGQDGILAGTDGNGLFLLRDGAIAEHYTKKDGLSSNVILKIIPVEGATNGDDDVPAEGASDADGTDSAGAPGGWLLVTSNSIALFRDGAIHTLESFPYSNNYDILEGEGGRMYVTGSAGLYLTTKEAMLSDAASDAFLVGPSNGFENSLTVNSLNQEEGGTLFLCTGSGLVGVETGKLTDSEQTIRLRVRNLYAGNTVIRAEDGVVPEISRDAGSVSIEAEMINFSPFQSPIRYRLLGYEETWHDASRSDLSEIVYGKLPAGSYTFQLQLTDRDTGDVQEACTFDFTVEEALEDTVGFRIYFIGTTIVFAAWFAWFITRLFMQRRSARAEEEVRKANERVAMGNKAIISIARALYAKDWRTGKHSYNVAYYSSKLGKAYGFSEKECTNLRKAALLHDIGKIAIPDAILNKPGRLTDEEYAVMKTHTTIGAEILSGFTLIDHVSEGAKYHHERYDGKGYPEGIAGTDIPLYGRIIAVADAYDAMTANRVYREKQDISFAADQIRKGRGTQFDPELADLFLDLIEKGEVDPEEVGRMYEKRDPEEDIIG